MSCVPPSAARVAAIALLLLVLAPSALGEDVLAPPEDAVAEAIAAAKANDTQALQRLVDSDTWEPWWAVHELCVRGEFGAARALAGATTRGDLEPLLTYAHRQSRRQPSATAFTHAVAIDAMAQEERWFDLVEYADEHRVDFDTKDVAGATIARLLGISRYKLDQEAAAIPLLWTSGLAAEELGWYAGAVRALDFCFAAALDERELRKALDVSERLAVIHARAGDMLQAAYSWIDVGSVHGSLANYGHAIERFEAVLREYGDILPEYIQAHVACNAGLANSSIGDYAKAQALYAEALELAVSAESAEYVAVAHEGLGSTAAEVGDEQTARAHFAKSRAQFEVNGDAAGVAGVIGQIGWMELVLGNDDAAMAHMLAALEMYEDLENGVFAARARANIGYLIGRSGDRRRALRELNSARREMEALDDRIGLVDVLSALAELTQLERDFQKALAYRNEQMEMAQRSGSFDLEARALTGLAEVYHARGDDVKALHHADLALGVLGMQFDRLPASQAASARRRVGRATDVGLAASLALGSVDDVCRYLEEGRAGALLTRLEGRRQIRSARISDKHMRREDVARQETTLARLEYLESRGSGKRSVMRKARERWEAARTELKAAIERIQLEGGVAADLLYPDVATRKEIQTVLAEGEALVVYGETDAEFIALVLTNQVARVARLGPSAPIEAACVGLRASASNASGGCDPAALRALVVTPLKLPASTKRVIVSPSGGLSYQPPSVLFPEHEVAAVVSGTLLTRLERSAPTSREVLALGNPTYAALTPDSEPTDPGFPSAPVLRSGLSPLPASGDEAKAVGDTVLVQGDATESRLREELSRDASWRAVHLACHGLLDEERPSYSALALTPNDKDDGELWTIEVYQMRIRADLVVLSACESGRGSLNRAEGLFGLTGAFIVAGAPRVIVSLWKVDDAATHALMTKFYELWNPDDPKQGIGAAAALKAAQADVRSHPEWEHPYYWAAWVLWGVPD